MFFFFFQAEDGIRDGTVTGVQTCALPISSLSLRATTLQPGDDRSADAGESIHTRKRPDGDGSGKRTGHHLDRQCFAAPRPSGEESAEFCRGSSWASERHGTGAAIRQVIAGNYDRAGGDVSPGTRESQRTARGRAPGHGRGVQQTFFAQRRSVKKDLTQSSQRTQSSRRMKRNGNPPALMTEAQNLAGQPGV